MTALLDRRCLALLAIIAAVMTTLMTIQLALSAHAHDTPPAEPGRSDSAHASTSWLSARA